MISEPVSMILTKTPDGERGLYGVGYWRDRRGEPAQAKLNGLLGWLGKALSLSPELPDPQQFVDPMWDPATRALVIRYLRAGRVESRYMGYSYCRFNCGIDDRDMGDATLTDGTFAWPEGFVHYLEKHYVRPPEEFVHHALGKLAQMRRAPSVEGPRRRA